MYKPAPFPQRAVGRNCAPRGHPFIRELLESLVRAYSDPGTFAIIGPSLVTSVARNFTGAENVLDITPDMGLNVVRLYFDIRYGLHLKCSLSRQNHISGVAAYRTPSLFKSPMSRDRWKHLLREASSIHFTASYTSKHFPNIDRDDPGSSAYSLLGPYLCPVALYSNDMYF